MENPVTDTDPDHPLVATCSYKEFRDEMGLPVRTSVGFPRWHLPYSLEFNMAAAAPAGALRKIGDRDVFVPAYRARLDGTGAEKFLEDFRALSEANDGKTIVLLCFENPLNSSTWCHRTIFAEWFEEKTGIAVPEFGVHRAHTPTPSLDAGLW